MDMRQITPRFFAAPQISVEDVPDIVAAGITRVICNRPDVEVPESHQAAALQTAVVEAGLEFFIRPLTHQTMTPEIIAENKGYIDGNPGKTLAYCASGTRSTIAWALGTAGELPADEIISAAQNGGYDLNNLRPMLEVASGS